jgi:hypothetical protein
VGFGLVIGLMENVRNVTASNCSAFALTLLLTTARTKTSHSVVSSPFYRSSVFKFLPPGDSLSSL